MVTGLALSSSRDCESANTVSAASGSSTSTSTAMSASEAIMGLSVSNTASSDDSITHVDESHSNLWEPRESIAHRFPGVHGITLWDLIMKHYHLGDGTFALFDDSYRGMDGKHIPLLVRSPLNDRDEGVTRQQYKIGMRSTGFNVKARSVCVVVAMPPGDRKHPSAKYVLAAAHCTEALSECWAEELDAVAAGRTPNDQIVSSVRKGMDALELKSATPEDIQRHVVYALNAHNNGSGFNLQQAFALRSRHQKSWTNHKERKQISVSRAGGQAAHEQLHRSWLKFESKCQIYKDKWPYYEAAFTFMNQAQLAGRWSTFEKFVAANVDNLNRRGTIEDIVADLAAHTTKHGNAALTQRSRHNSI